MKIEKWSDINTGGTSEQRMEAFLDTVTDSFAILQLKHTDETRDMLFESYGALQRMGMEPEIDHYDVIYVAPMPVGVDRDTFLESTFTRFNIDIPPDFRGHSLSVSDVVMLKQGSEVSSHYVDTIGFMELPGFDAGKNHLRTVEDMIEANDNNLDGIINNLPEQPPTKKAAEAQERTSVLEKLKEMKIEPPKKVKPPHEACL